MSEDEAEQDGAAPTPVTAVAVAAEVPVSHTTKVRIETPGATIEVEAKAALDEVARTALDLFHQAGGWPRENYRSSGFATAERRDTPAVQPSSMPWAPADFPAQP
ncbi:hypothetical protein [Actinoplanes sp. NPDC049265]|uniref:hypothetical protein n=1 Tax=Actinoplanes sp. NPDC049265 TaxID=3363902 RepID=UPI003716DB7E